MVIRSVPPNTQMTNAKRTADDPSAPKARSNEPAAPHAGDPSPPASGPMHIRPATTDVPAAVWSSASESLETLGKAGDGSTGAAASLAKSVGMGRSASSPLRTFLRAKLLPGGKVPADATVNVAAAPPKMTAPLRCFVAHLRDTLDHFPVGKGVTYNGQVNPVIANDMVAPLMGVHDWIDHVFFGRALTIAGDRVDAYLLGTKRRNSGGSVEDLAQFQVDHRLKLDHLAQNPTAPIDITELPPRNERAYLLRDLQPDELLALAETRERGLERLLPMGTARAREVRAGVREKLIGRALREDVFTAEREILMVPWVLGSLNRILAGLPPDPAAEEAMRAALAALNHRYQTDPNAGVLDEGGRNELQRAASEQKRLVYDRATQVLEQLDQQAAECNPGGPSAGWPSRWGKQTALGALLARLDASSNGPVRGGEE